MKKKLLNTVLLFSALFTICSLTAKTAISPYVPPEFRNTPLGKYRYQEFKNNDTYRVSTRNQLMLLESPYQEEQQLLVNFFTYEDSRGKEIFMKYVNSVDQENSASVAPKKYKNLSHGTSSSCDCCAFSFLIACLYIGAQFI